MIGKKAFIREISAAARVARESDAMNTSKFEMAYPMGVVSGNGNCGQNDLEDLL
jgi:hypothetical protein